MAGSSFGDDTSVSGTLAIIEEQGSSPSAPSAGAGGILFTKSDGKLYWISDDVSEVEISAGGGGDNEFSLVERGFTYTHTSNTYWRTLPGSAGGIGQWTTAEVGSTTNATDTITIDFQIAGASGAAFIAPAACTITGLRGYVKCGSGADVITARLYKCTGTDDTSGTSDAMTATQINAGAAISAATNGNCFTFSETISSNNALSAGESLLLAFSADGTSTQKNYFTITILGAWS